MTLLERLKQLGLVFRKELERLVGVISPLPIQTKDQVEPLGTARFDLIGWDANELP